MKTRPDILNGVTYHAKLPEGKPLFITVNELNGKPYEVFIRMDDPNTFEWVVGFTIIITRLLRAGEPLDVIAHELMEVYSPVTMHQIPGGGGNCPSLIARIGKVLLDHHGV